MPQTKTSIAVITDVHYGDSSPASRRRCNIADILMERAVRRLNRLVRPDVVLVLGDLVDDGNAPEAQERLTRLRTILDTLDAPYLAIPGNHDGDTDAFYRVFDRPAPWVDVAGVRYMAFIDQEEPGYNATRSERDIARTREARTRFSGPIVALQHVCLFPPDQDRVAPYNYTNAPDIIDALREANVILSVSGHHHHGAENTHAGGVTFVNAPGLCESPFTMLEIGVENDTITTRRIELALSPELGLVDNHLHTELAYCSENMTVPRTVDLARDFGLTGVTFTEHSGQLYYDRKPYWGNAWLEQGVNGIDPSHNRMQSYLEMKRNHEDDFAHFSLEVECDAQGRLLVTPDDQEHFGSLMGTIHALPGLTRENPPGQRQLEQFLSLLDSMGRKGIQVLAHPLRIFRRMGWEAPEALFDPTTRLLREHNIAAEINFHTNEPPLGFIRSCLANGVKFSFGSDAHNLSEIGDFAYHIALLREAGYDGELNDVLIGRLA